MKRNLQIKLKKQLCIWDQVIIKCCTEYQLIINHVFPKNDFVQCTKSVKRYYRGDLSHIKLWFLIAYHSFMEIYSQRYPMPTYLIITEIKFNRTCIIGTQPFSWPTRKKGQQQHSASAIYSSPRNRQPAYFLEKSSKPWCASTSRTRFVC